MFIPLAERLKRLEQVVGLTLPKEDDFGFDVSGYDYYVYVSLQIKTLVTISLYEYDHLPLPLPPKNGNYSTNIIDVYFYGSKHWKHQLCFKKPHEILFFIIYLLLFVFFKEWDSWFFPQPTHQSSPGMSLYYHKYKVYNKFVPLPPPPTLYPSCSFIIYTTI